MEEISVQVFVVVINECSPVDYSPLIVASQRTSLGRLVQKCLALCIDT